MQLEMHLDSCLLFGSPDSKRSDMELHLRANEPKHPSVGAGAATVDL